MQNNKTCCLISNLIYGNAQGIYLDRLDYASAVIEILNNTIVYNTANGIARDLSTNAADPNINSNIIWGNTTNLDGTFTKVNYNCIQGGYAGTGNTSTPPQLDAEYHLTALSASCIDNGNPAFASSAEKDIDGELRCLAVAGTVMRIDIGADELNPYDVTGNNDVPDGVVDFLDFAAIADHWRTSYTAYDFYADGMIDTKDLKKFCEYWLMGDVNWYLGGEGAEFAEVEYECPSSQMMMSVGTSIYSMRSAVIPSEAEIAGESMIYAESEIISEPVDVNGLLNWLDDLWQNDEEIRSSMTEDEYLEFRSAIENIE